MVLGFLDSLPTWAMALAVCGGSVALTTIAQTVIHRRWPIDARRPLNEVAGFIIAVVGVIYAVLLASIAILAIERYDRAERITETEAGLVSDVFRAAAGLPQPLRAAIRDALIDYADTVIDVEWPVLVTNGLDGSAWQERGWQDLERLMGNIADFTPQSTGQEVFMQQILGQIVELNDARRLRMFLADNPLDAVIWWVVVAGGFSTVGLAFLFGVQNTPGHLVVSNLLAFSIGLAFVLIIAMDRPFSGEPRATAEPFRYVLERMKMVAAGP